VRIRDLIWDAWNEGHIERHDVLRAEVEYVCADRRSLGVRIRGKRYRVIGQSEDGRYLTVFLDAANSGEYYVVTARKATDSERHRLHRWRGR
jgi:uncharacterized DUF497 family protein